MNYRLIIMIVVSFVYGWMYGQVTDTATFDTNRYTVKSGETITLNCEGQVKVTGTSVQSFTLIQGTDLYKAVSYDETSYILSDTQIDCGDVTMVHDRDLKVNLVFGPMHERPISITTYPNVWWSRAQIIFSYILFLAVISIVSYNVSPTTRPH
jgi:hypothetical protein